MFGHFYLYVLRFLVFLIFVFLVFLEIYVKTLKKYDKSFVPMGTQILVEIQLVTSTAKCNKPSSGRKVGNP